MKSDFRTPRMEWPLQPLLWALPLLLTTLTISTVSSDKSVYTKDSHWIPLDKNFPPTKDELQPQTLNRFFYARGKFLTEMNLTMDALTTILKEPAESYHVKFQIFRSNIQCVKYFAVGQENITYISNEGSDWSTIDRHYTAEEFLKFRIWLSAQNQCEQSVVAIKDLTVTYNRYEKDTRNESNNANEHLFKDLHFTPDGAKLGWKTFFHDCNKANVCNFTVPESVTKENDATIQFWHSHSKKVEVLYGEKIETIDPDKLGKIRIFKGSKDVVVEINVKEDADKFHSIISAQLDDKKSLPRAHSAFELTPDMDTFLQNHHDTKVLTDYGQVSSAAVLFSPQQKDMNENTCYDLNYIISSNKDSNVMYRLSVELHGDQTAGETYVNRYDLFDFAPVANGKADKVNFCLRDYFFKPGDLVAKGQLYLESINSATSKTSANRLAIVALTPLEGTSKSNTVRNFIEADDEVKWETLLPDPEKTLNKSEPSIKASTHETTYQLRTVWLNKQDLHKKDAHLKLVIDNSAEADDRSKLLKLTTLSGLVCDDINECTIMKESHHQKDGNLEYRLNFDGHPRKESTELKMQLTIKLPKISKDTTVTIDLISFGDPCHENCFGNPDKKCDSNGLIANDFTGACKCKEGYSGDKCTIVNQCIVHKTDAMAACKEASKEKELKDICRNDREDKSYECVCPDPIKIWDKQSKTCEEDPQIISGIKIEPQENTKTKTSKWSYNLEFIRKDYYDICFHMELNKNDFVGTLSLALQSKDSSTNIELISSQTLIHHQKVEKLIDLCLGNFIDLDSFQIAKWDLEIKVNTDSELIWEKNDLSIYGNKKPETKSQASQNAFPEKVQNNLYTLTHNQQNEQTLKINVPMSQNGKVNVNAYIISDWIVNNKSINAEKIKRNILKVESSAQSILHADVYICQPRTGNKQLDCQLYNEGSLPEILPSLSGNKFQIKLHLHTDGEQDQTLLANLEVTTKISFWEPCQLVEQDKDGCHNRAKCEVDQTNGFKCVNCDRTKYLGDRCQYDKDIICNPNAENICKNIGTNCTVNEEGTGFKCVCHKGYVFNSQTNKCDRMKVNNLEWTCTPGKCFINGITGEDFVYLPRYFPSLDKTETSKSNSLYFTTATDSRLSVSVSELDPSKAATQDVCIQFKYFIGPNSSLTVRFNDQLDLLTIDGNVSPLGLSLPMTTTATKVCIRAYLPPGKMVDLTDVNLALITRIADTDEAVALELVSFTVGEKYHNVETISLPEHGLNYLTRHSVDVEGAPPNAEITYQWPARFPDRWTPTVKGYNYKSRIDSYPDVIGMAILESSWIDRPLKVSGHSAFSKVYLNFKMILRQQIVEENFKVDIYVLDSNRRPIGGVVGTLTNKNFNTKPTPINKEFAISVSRDIEKGQLYKVQFHIKYKDIQSNTEDTTLFDIEDISFGDPCININEEENTGDKQVCYNYDEKKFNVVPDSSIKCLRIVKQSGAMDYQCDCQNKNLHGKNCLDADYCQLKHIVSFRQNVAEIPKALKGDDFCVKNVKKAKCTKKVILHDYKFMCLCEEPKQKFNYETQTCDDIDACSLITCKFETEFCKKNATNHANCECKKGFELKEGVCKPVDTESECTVADRNKVSCADPNMKCLYSASGDPFCRCDKGFKQELSKETKDPICVSDMCNFAGLHNCPQGCTNIDKEPYYECKCDENSIKVLTKEGTVDVTECQPKTSSPCKEWSGRYKTCIGGVKGCTDNYRLNEKGDDCVPKPTYRMTACPNNFAYRFDEAAKEYACNCKNTSDYFGNDPAMRSTCTITKSICDAEEPGRKLCNARGAGCLVNPLRIDDFTCLCHIGAMFPDVKQHKSASLVRENPKMNCIDVCDLPFKKSQCAAIGAQCNPTKLWLALETVQIGPTTIEEIAAVSYCDCVPGTFYDKNHRSCIQEPKALNLNITFLWSEKLNVAYDEAIEAAYSLFIPELLEDKSVGLEVIDPIGFARVERAAMRLNKEEAAAAEAAWNNQFLFNMLNDEANMLFHIFDLAKAKNQIDQDVQALSLQKVDLNGRLAYTVQLAAKIPESVYLTEPEEAYNSISSEGDELQADATATTVAPTTPTTAAAPTTTGAPTRDTSLNYNLTIYNELINYCASVDDNGKCVITFNNFFESPLYLHKEAVRPILHEPCKYQGACNGMSNCHPLNGSTFECTCGENFEAELRYTFKTRDNNIVYRNEYCKAQDLCASNCLDGEKAHTKCYHRAPRRASITSPWVNEYDCDCVEKYVRQGANSTCTYVCAQHNCGGDHGECLPSAKSASCKCKDGFYGDHCEHTVGSNTWWIVGIVVLGVLALAAIGAAVFFWRSDSHNNHLRSSSPFPSTSQTQTTVTDKSRQANIRRITAKADLTSVKHHEYEGQSQQSTTAETSTKHPHLTTSEPEHSQHYQISNTNHNITTIKSTQQQKSASSAEPGPLEPGQTSFQLQQQISPDQNSTSSSSTETENTSQTGGGGSLNRYSSNTARSSFVGSAADLDSVNYLSRQTSINSLTVHEPFTPYNASPRSTMYGGARKSIVVPIMEESEQQLYKSSFSHSTTRSSTSSSNSSSEEEKSKTETSPSNGPPEPGHVVFTESKEEETNSSSSSSEIEPSTSQMIPFSARPTEPSTKMRQQPNQDLLRDSQEMDSAKFQHVRAKIAAVLKLNSNKTYKVSQPNSPEVSRR